MRYITFKNIYYLLTVLLIGGGLVFGLTGCDEDEYNFDDIEPVVFEIEGPTTVRGGTTETYRALSRGGSSYEFTQTGAIAQSSLVDGEPYTIIIDFEEHTGNDPLPATISVVETAMGGEVSPEYTKSIDVLPLDLNMVGQDVVAITEGEPKTLKYTVDFYYPDASYSWTVDGTDFTIEGGTDGNTLELIYGYPSELNTEIEISVEVTTRGGNTLTDDLTVTSWQFCPLDVEFVFDVEWQGTATLATDPSFPIESDPIIIKDPLELPSEILDNPFVSVGLPPAFSGYDIVVEIDGLASNFLNNFWGEAWVSGGTSLAIMYEPEGEIEIPLQFLGKSDYPDNYWIIGYGEYNYCVPSLTIYYAFGYGGPDADEDPNDVDLENDITWVFGWDEDEGEPNYITTVLTPKGSTKSYSIDLEDVINMPINKK